MSFPPDRSKESSLPPGGTARSAKGAPTGSASEARLLAAFRRLDAPARASLQDFADFLAERAPRAVAAPEPRPAQETVVQAIRRLSRSYPGLGRHALMPAAERLLAQHMVDGRPAAEVIDELERHCAARAGDAT